MTDVSNEPDPTAAQESAPSPSPAKSSVSNLVVFVVMLAAITGLGYFAGQYVQEFFAKPVEPRDAHRYEVRLRGDEPQRGPDDALVTIIEFSDFQCPYCGNAVGPLEEAMASFEGDVRLIFKHFPLPGHPNAIPAARTAWAGQQQGKFWEFHDWLFESRGSIESLPSRVKELGLDADKLGVDMESEASSDAVDDDRIAGGVVGIRGTPGFVVNGHIYGGAMNAGQWRKIISSELDAAESLMSDEDLDRAEVYASLMKTAETKRGPGPVPSVGRRPGAPDPAKHYRVEAGEGRPARGAAEPLVTIVEFADFHCPFCAKAAATVRRVSEAFPEDVRVVYRHHPLPMHRRARAAAGASLAAHAQGKFWEMHDLIFERDAKSEGDLRALAEELGLDLTKFDADRADPKYATLIDEDMAVARQFNANGTPAFFINGRFLAGARSGPEIRQVVQEELERAKALIAAGTPRAQVFDKVMEIALTEVEK